MYGNSLKAARPWCKVGAKVVHQLQQIKLIIMASLEHVEHLAARMETLEPTVRDTVCEYVGDTVRESKKSDGATPCANSATCANTASPATSRSLPLNWDDVDPISLEPVCALWPYFEIAQVDNILVDSRVAGTKHAEASANEVTCNATCKDQQEQEEQKEIKPRVRRYDAWAWLEMLRRDTTGQYRHPVTGERIDVKGRAACVKACMQACREAHLLQQSMQHVQHVQQSAPHMQPSVQPSVQQRAKQLQRMAHLLEPCGTSLNVERAIERDPLSGELVRVQFYAVDPSLEVILTAAWARPTVDRLHNTDSGPDTDTERDLDNKHPPAWASAVNSKVATQYDIRDAAGRVLAHRTAWFG